MNVECRLLVVESHPVFATLVQQMAQAQSQVKAEVVVVPDMANAVRSLAVNDYDIIFFDISLHAEEDPEFWESLVAVGGGAGVVVLGGPDDFEIMVKAMESGAYECLFRNMVSSTVLGDYLHRGLVHQEIERLDALDAKENTPENIFADLDNAIDEIEPIYHPLAFANGGFM